MKKLNLFMLTTLGFICLSVGFLLMLHFLVVNHSIITFAFMFAYYWVAIALFGVVERKESQYYD